MTTPWMKNNRDKILSPQKREKPPRKVYRSSRPEFNEKAIKEAKERLKAEKDHMKQNADEYGILRKGSR